MQIRTAPLTLTVTVIAVATLGLFSSHCSPERRGSGAGGGGGGEGGVGGGGQGGAQAGAAQGGPGGGGQATRPDEGSFVADDDGQVQVDPTAGDEDVVVSSESQRASVVIPPNALAQPTEITIVSRPLSAFTGTSNILDGVYDFGPDGLQFSEPVTILLPTNGIAADDLADAELVVWQNDGWTAVPDANVQITPSHISGQVTHFTPYGVRLPAGLPGMEGSTEEGDDEGGDEQGAEQGDEVGDEQGEEVGDEQGDEVGDEQGDEQGDEVAEGGEGGEGDWGKCDSECMSMFEDSICCEGCGCMRSGACEPWCGEGYRWDCEWQCCFDYEALECHPATPPREF